LRSNGDLLEGESRDKKNRVAVVLEISVDVVVVGTL
jgi:hypothetical protein